MAEKILKEWKEERNASGLTSKKTIKELAREFKVSEPTILKWRKRENSKTSWEEWQVEAIKYIREKLLLPLDDLLEVVRTRAYRPQTNGMVERFNGRVSEVLKGVKVRDYVELWRVLRVYWWDYIFRRKQRVLGGRSPWEVLLEKWEEYPELFWIDPREHFKDLPNNFPGLDNNPHTIFNCEKINL